MKTSLAADANLKGGNIGAQDHAGEVDKIHGTCLRFCLSVALTLKG